jgi:hypothetical protein
MAALTAEKNIEIKNPGDLYAFPVANGETIYGGTLAVIDDDGYLRNLSSTYAPQCKLVCLVADESANASGPAATSAAGSISGSLEISSAVSGDKTIRNVYLHGLVKGTFTSIAQADVGQPVFATTNNDIDEARNSAVFVGTLMVYISATVGWYELNGKYNSSDTVVYKTALTAASGGGGMFNILNPAAATILIEKLVIDITTASTVTGVTIDAGVAATATSNDTLIDGGALTATGIIDNGTDAGTNGGLAKCTSAQYITGTGSSALGAHATPLVGSVSIYYRHFE